MAKKNVYGTIILIAILIAGSIIGLSSLAVTSDTVYVPQYWTAECVARPDSSQLTDYGNLNGGGEFLECTTNGNPAKYYIPEGQTCEFTLVKTVSGLSTFSVYDCPLNTLERNIKDECDKQSAFLSDQRTFTVSQGRKLWVDPFNLLGIGKVSLKARYPSYGLQVESLGGYKPPVTTSCALSSYNSAVDTKVHLLDDVNFPVKPGVAVNSITALSPIKSNMIVSISGIEGGDIIYVNKPGYYFPILEAKDGTLYADILNQKSNDKIECVPGSPGCSDDAKVVLVEDSPCSAYGGVIDGYAPVEGSTAYCKYDCVDGKLRVTSDCISFATCDPKTEKMNYATGECVSLDTKDPVITNLPVWVIYLLIGLGALVLIMLILIISNKQGPGPSGPRPVRRYY